MSEKQILSSNGQRWNKACLASDAPHLGEAGKFVSGLLNLLKFDKLWWYARAVHLAYPLSPNIDL